MVRPIHAARTHTIESQVGEFGDSPLGQAGRHGTARDGTGRGGTGRDGTGRDGTGRDGMGRDGTGRDGTGRDGRGREGTAGLFIVLLQHTPHERCCEYAILKVSIGTFPGSDPSRA